MSGEYRVDPEALRRFARTSADRSEKLRAIRAELGAHRLSTDAFGKLPEAEQTGRDYAERADAAVENISSAADTMARIDEHVQGVARNYEQAEAATADSLDAIVRGL
ncbi:type VII secretion target [Kitasatospora sp. DSM 101779]|uniref:type VII secretion target n=1 Tax=Kitasatospora sp. DSM 101779 TaxID=2853165 RepID=UPI0021DB04BB|nr:hypothetical protein [Kitasatospora sp. DSM 101779]MCU7825413.1 hypothetical protein [Kitasatospora sp. DSM 101779]